MGWDEGGISLATEYLFVAFVGYPGWFDDMIVFWERLFGVYYGARLELELELGVVHPIA